MKDTSTLPGGDYKRLSRLARALGTQTATLRDAFLKKGIPLWKISDHVTLVRAEDADRFFAQSRLTAETV